jgi:hypothetical protein
MDPNYCDASGKCEDHNIAYGFTTLDNLHPLQTQLLEHLRDRYREWTESNDDQAATFISLTHALNRMEVKIDQDQWVPSLVFVESVNRFLGDRAFLKLNAKLFDRWRVENKGEFRIKKADGSIESGRFRFKRGGSFGGSLHKGFEIQASTSVAQVPRIQINYRFSDSVADIDIDGQAPWKWGWFPNLKHLKYSNSDVRQWFESFVKKFGDPGFQVRPY